MSSFKKEYTYYKLLLQLYKGEWVQNIILVHESLSLSYHTHIYNGWILSSYGRKANLVTTWGLRSFVLIFLQFTTFLRTDGTGHPHQLLLHIIISIVNVFKIDSIHGHLLIILLHGSEILTGLRKLSFLHTLSDVPMDKGTARVQ